MHRSQRQRADATPPNRPGRVECQAARSKTDRTTSRRTAWSHFEVPEALRGSRNCQSGSRSYDYQGDRGHRELPGPTRGSRTTPCFICGVSQGRWTGQWDARVAGKHLSSIAKHVQENSNIDRDAVAQSLLCLLVPAPPPIPPDALRSGTPNNTADMCNVSNRGSKHEGSADWPQHTNKVRLTTKTMTEETPQLEDTKGCRR